MLREVRRKRGLTQGQLAERLGETQSSVSKWERGEHRLNIIELRRVCLAMGVPLVLLVQRLEEAIAGEAPEFQTPGP